ncbi:MAG: 16S rRNA (guanine(527)-N(7))-methyltransferase RsmG [Clostridia bacterium]|nr:16S rRNA (guanine(527)-N(7))-methyltransferase RsmG [Clostridia bacterium]
MEKIECINYLKDELNKIGITIDENKSELLYLYMEQLLEWNTKINLTAIRNRDEFIVKHLVDSLSITKYLDYNEDSRISIIDVGTGGGFPGIPLKLYYHNSKVTLLDSINKKLNVIKDISEKIKINNLEFVHGRAEEIGHKNQYREKYDIVVSRAVANLTTLVEYLIPLCKLNEKIVCMKGPGAEEELQRAQKAITLLGGQVEKVIDFKIGNENRWLIIIKKIKKTPSQYPREIGIPLKKPIE